MILFNKLREKSHTIWIVGLPHFLIYQVQTGKGTSGLLTLIIVFVWSQCVSANIEQVVSTMSFSLVVSIDLILVFFKPFSCTRIFDVKMAI